MLGFQFFKCIVFKRQDSSLTLFGFLSRLDKKFFLTLLKVNGVGPKLALNLMSGASVENLQKWIEAGDVKALTQMPKVGKKTAEQIILTLKGQLVFSEDAQSSPKSLQRSQISSALVNLGFRLQDVEKVVEQVPHEVDVEDGIRRCLSVLSGTL